MPTFAGMETVVASPHLNQTAEAIAEGAGVTTDEGRRCAAALAKAADRYNTAVQNESAWHLHERRTGAGEIAQEWDSYIEAARGYARRCREIGATQQADAMDALIDAEAAAHDLLTSRPSTPTDKDTRYGTRETDAVAIAALYDEAVAAHGEVA